MIGNWKFNFVDNDINDNGVQIYYEKMREMDSISLQELHCDEEALTSFGQTLVRQAIARDPAMEETIERLIEEKKQKEQAEQEQMKMKMIPEQIQEHGEDQEDQEDQEEGKEEEERQETRRGCCVFM